MTRPDFRSALYERYESTFKKAGRNESNAAVESYRRWCRSKMLPLISDIDRESPILELGCGPGHFLAFLAHEGFRHVRGVDISAEQVALAKRRGVDALCGDATELLLEAANGEYAAIVALDFVEHFTKDELLGLLPRIHDALRPGGVLLLQTPNGEGLFPNQVAHSDLTHLTILTPGSLEQLLNLVGFQRILFQETDPVPTSVRGLVRWILWQGIRGIATAIRKIETGKSQRIWTENMICRAQRAR